MRQMAVEDIEAGLRFCRASGWNQLEADWLCFLRANPAGCRVAVENGEVAGTVTTLRFEDRFSWISMLLVPPEKRGRGIGTALLLEALRVLEDVRCVRLDATPAGKAVYDRFGFRDEYPLVRMRTDRLSRVAGEGVRRMEAPDVEAVERWDRTVFGAERRVVLEHLRESDAFVAEAGGEIAGYAMSRRGFLAPQMGPVVARDGATAGALVSAFGAGIIDVPEANAGWLEAMGFRRERTFMRMYRGEAPDCRRKGEEFAIAGPEFG
jgi:ribosomal protein S18 acetylase RimI-like enzyme